MRILIADQAFSGQKVLENVLAKVGSCHVVPDGEQALFAFRRAWSEGKPFQLVCIDISISKVDLNQALQEIRQIEKQHGVKGESAVRVLYLTSPVATNKKELKQSDPLVASVAKPVNAQELENQLKEFGLLG